MIRGATGSSPQARGTLPTRFFFVFHERFIPAGAGNTPSRRPRCVTVPVHPRRRGEHVLRWMLGNVVCGSSPQARGTPLSPLPGTGKTRFIPAGAGNTSHTAGSIWRDTVHPRRRGEHQIAPARPGLVVRFIPAGAGNTLTRFTFVLLLSVHPRRRGEHNSMEPAWSGSTGSSPQARGTLGARILVMTEERFIPAGAGNTICGAGSATRPPVHPRRRGEHATRRGTGINIDGSSPQARGTRRRFCRCQSGKRFIPAGAGNTYI